MSTLSSASTDAEIRAAYDDNASYEEDNSSSKARTFVTACRLLLRRMPKMATHSAIQLALSPDLVQNELLYAQQWLAVNSCAGGSGNSSGVNGGVKHFSFEWFR